MKTKKQIIHDNLSEGYSKQVPIGVVIEKCMEEYAEAKAGQHEPIVMLRYDDAIKIAKGCFDYSGGHRDKELEIYHHGIQTVINALKGAKKSNLSDLQSKVLHHKGKAT